MASEAHPTPAAPEPEADVQSTVSIARVKGEPLVTIPQDLYIPPDALEIVLEAFEGPLDLLLYLIRRQNLDILELPIAEITQQYMHYVELMQDLRLELAAEYLVMAVVLAQIKSRLLLPRQAGPEPDEDDPRVELVRRLQEYEQFKEAAQSLDELPRIERDIFTGHAQAPPRTTQRIEPKVSLQDLLGAFTDVLSRAEHFAHHRIQREALSVRERMVDVLGQLGCERFCAFTELFPVKEGRLGVTVTFLAVLELLRERLIELRQDISYAPIYVRAASAAATQRTSGPGNASGG